MTNKPLSQQWKPAVLLLDKHEEGKWPFKAYAQYGEGDDAVYDLNATTVNVRAAWEHAQDLAAAYNRAGTVPAMLSTSLRAAQLPAGMFLPPPPRNEAAEQALRDLIALGEEIARNPKGPR